MTGLFYPILRFRNDLTQEYIAEEVRNGARGYATYEEAKLALKKMNTDDCDYEICIYRNNRWCVTRDGFTVFRRWLG